MGKRLGSAAGLLLVASAVGFSACGSSEGRTTAAETASQQIILTLSDLPLGSKWAAEPLTSEQCSPASHFRKYAQSVLSPPGFYLPEDELLQQVGIFKSHSEAAKAFRQVLSAKARHCVERKMQVRSISLAGSKGVIISKRFPNPVIDGITAGAIRLHFTHPMGILNVEQTTLVDRRALTTLTFVSRDHLLSRDVWRTIVGSTAAALRAASADLEA